MADSLREYVKIRDVNGIVRFLTVNLGPPIVSALTLSTPTPLASFEEKPYPAILDYVTLMDSAGFPWHARISALGAIETRAARLFDEYGIRPPVTFQQAQEEAERPALPAPRRNRRPSARRR